MPCALLMALADGLTRASAHFGVEGESVERLTGDLLAQKCRALGVDRIVSAYLPVGPMAEQIAKARPALDKAGIALVEIRREEDSLTWPHATKGFFGLRERIPDLLGKMGILGEGEPQADLFATNRRTAAHR